MTPAQQQAMIELVTNAIKEGEGHQQNGVFEFTLDNLPYDVSLKLHDFVLQSVKPILRAEKKKAQDRKRWEEKKRARKERQEREKASMAT